MGKSLKGKELGKNIVQRHDGLYQARYINRFGKRISLYGDTPKEVTERLQKEKYEDARHTTVQDKKITLNEWYDIWITVHKCHCRDTTLHTYEIQYNRLRPLIGNCKLCELKPDPLQEAFNQLKSDASRSDCKALLVDMLNRAIKSEKIYKNVALGINTTIDNEEQFEKRILSDDEIKTLLAVPKSESLQNFLIVALQTGMRMGEILGLTWDCIDFQDKLIKINKTLVYLPNNGDAIYEFHPTKTKAGKRSIAMTKEVEAALLAQQSWKRRVAQRHNPRVGLEDLVFCSKTNNPIHETNVRRAINEIVAKINRDNADIKFERFTPHCLRHTFATKCIAKGMQPKTLQKILGHNSLQMTMDLYCHVEEDTMREQMSLFGEMA